MKAYLIQPLKELKSNIIEIPGSKSYTNRALIIASLANGKSILKNALISDDIIHLIDSLRLLGIKIEIDGNKITVQGKGGIFDNPKKELNLGLSGTGIRLMVGVASLCKKQITLTGVKRLLERPIGPLTDALRQLGVFYITKKGGLPPAIKNEGTIIGGTCSIKGDISSQFFTSIMLIAPYAKEDIIIKVIGKLISRPYIDITIDIMKSFGVSVVNNDYKEFIIKTGQKYTAKKYVIEGDVSSASFFFCLAAITRKKLKIKNINSESVQGDINLIGVLKEMGCTFESKENSIIIQGPNKLKNIDVDMNSMPDAVPALSSVCAFANGKSTIKNISNLRIKESDRIESVKEGLNKLNIKTKDSKNSLTIYGGKPKGPASIKTYEDHRIAMSFAILGTKVENIVIEDPDCVSKSFPTFWNKLKKIGVEFLDA